VLLTDSAYYICVLRT